jgi:4-diphosphocytidyl-2-C-methyl-D-erythritol kinase
MVAFPNCKINLGLHIVEKRADGFHNIETCFYPVPIADILEIIPSEKFSFQSSGLQIPGDDKSNLSVKAFYLLSKDFSLKPVSIHLHKTIPLGAGLGGGSSDAASMLMMLNEIFSLGISQSGLHRYAENLGSDCAFFVYNRPMMGTDKGQVLNETNVSLKGKFIVIVKPPIHVSTADAYAGVTPKDPEFALVDILARPIEEWKRSLRNDFEVSVFKKYPEIERIKGALYDAGAAYASMSGSGSTVFAIFNSAVSLREMFPGCFYWSGDVN